MINYIKPYATLILAGLAALLLALAGWWLYSKGADSVQVKFDAYVLEARVQGEVAEKEAKVKEASDKAKQLKANHENNAALAALRADIKRMRDSRSTSSYLPSAPASASRPDLTCFDRTELESTIRAFDTGLQVLVDAGSEATVNLNTAKQWAQP